MYIDKPRCHEFIPENTTPRTDSLDSEWWQLPIDYVGTRVNLFTSLNPESMKPRKDAQSIPILLQELTTSRKDTSEGGRARENRNSAQLQRGIAQLLACL
jgi:hypothetical protein